MTEAIKLQTPEERTAFLDQHCNGDRKKHAHIQALLEAQEAIRPPGYVCGWLSVC